MADEQQIISGSFKGVPIAIDSSSITGGRKHSIKQFPSRDTQSVEDLGLLPRKYTLDIIISDKNDQDYFAYRDALIATLESQSSGVLIHPLYGRIENIKAVSFSISENFGSFGDTVVTVSFEPDNNTGIPTTSGNVVTQINAVNEDVVTAVSDDVSDNFSVTESFTGNFTSAVDKVNEMIEEANTATEFIGETSDNVNEFSAELGEISSNVNSLVSSPLALAQSLTNLFQSVNGLYASATSTFETFVEFFGFGDDDVDVRQDTTGRVERDNNNQVLNGAMNSSALGYAYLSAVQIDFENTDQIDVVAAQLDDQYELVQSSGSSNEVKDSLTDMRVQVLAAFDQARLTTPRVLTVNTLVTSTRLLAFDYYGNDEQGQLITDLNNVADVSFIEGDVKVLTS